MIAAHRSGRSREGTAGDADPLPPQGLKVGRTPVWPRSQLIDGVRLRVRVRVRNEVPGRYVPFEYVPWNRIYDLFRRPQQNGARRGRYKATVLVAAISEWLWPALVTGGIHVPRHRQSAAAEDTDELNHEGERLGRLRRRLLHDPGTEVSR